MISPSGGRPIGHICLHCTHVATEQEHAEEQAKDEEFCRRIGHDITDTKFPWDAPSHIDCNRCGYRWNVTPTP